MTSTPPVIAHLVPELRARRMGTELMGPLLHSLVRSVRAEQVLEVGSGLTTLYLLAALRENADDDRAERLALTTKEAGYDARWMDDEAVAEDPSAVLRWLEADPPLANPRYYDRPYQPCCTTIDTAGSKHGSGARVADAAARAGLGGLLDIRIGDFRDFTSAFHDDHVTFDLVWYDCGGAEDYTAFLDGYWDLVRPDGGLLILHYTLTVPSHERAVARALAARGGPGEGRFEVLNLLEPHKLMQNSCTVVRRCTQPPPRYAITRPISLERDA